MCGVWKDIGVLHAEKDLMQYTNTESPDQSEVCAVWSGPSLVNNIFYSINPCPAEPRYTLSLQTV